MGPQRLTGGPWTAPELPLAILDTTGKVGDIVESWGRLLGRCGPAAGPQLADGSDQVLGATGEDRRPDLGGG